MFIEKLTTPQRLTLSFALVVVVGSILLSLPIMHQSGVQTVYLDHLFTTVSMVCVTGLTVLTVGDVYNIYGQIICIILMQIGGLGLITMLSASALYLKKKLTLKEQYTLQASFSNEHNLELKPLLKSIYLFTFSLEAIAAFILTFIFVPRYGWFKGIFNSVFIAVSAFCNAGFDNLGSISLQGEVTNVVLNLTIASLIIAGGVGFIVWFEVTNIVKEYFKSSTKVFRIAFKKLSTHARLVLLSTGILLTLGTFLTWLTEYGNTNTLAKYSLPQQLLISFFQTVSMRTAGFSTLDYTLTRPITNLLYIIQMVIGGAPGGTAGGFKITTAAILVLLFKAELNGQREIQFRRRTIRNEVIKQTIVVLTFFFTAFMLGWALLLTTQTHLDPFSLLFEVASALATVGVTMNLTSELDTFGRIIIMCLMFIGRVGPATILLSIMSKPKRNIHYANADIYIG